MSDLRAPAAITAVGEHGAAHGEQAAGQAALFGAVSAETAAPGAREIVSRREYGRRKGWAPSYIVKLVQRGVLSVFSKCAECGGQVNSRAAKCEHCGASTSAVDWKRGGIDPALAELELQRARDPARDATRERWAEQRAPGSPGSGGADRASGGEMKQAGGPADSEADDSPVEDLERATFAQARAARERVEARMKQLQLEEQLGNLVRADLVRQEQMRAARRVRDAVMAVPAHVCHELAAEQHPARVLIRLEAELNNALVGVGEQLQADAGAGQQ